MNFMDYIVENALVLIPVLYLFGEIIKGIGKIPNKYIPLILLALGMGGALWLLGPSVGSAVQGLMVTGVTVYGNQVVKQMRKEE